MGCITSKHGKSVVAVSPDYPELGATQIGAGLILRGASSKNGSGLILAGASSKRQSGRLENVKDMERTEGSNHSHRKASGELRRSKKGSSGRSSSFSISLSLPKRLVEAEQVAAGWPPWLSSAAGEAVHGWAPLHADAYEKLEKIGQGTYSSVFRAREVITGKLVALKKVRFDNFQPDSIRFMAREIMILRRLDHPNIMKLDGLITSAFSSSIYLVFEYMEHDLAGLSTCPNIKFSESQIKCYMTQLLCGLEHCHLRGVMHRDIKASNILISNEGILKLADFGLANIVTPQNVHQLTSRVVTLWYRPPELLLGSKSYEVSVDLWSVGCVFAELLLKKPLLKGRTEVEQLHKIFKLCGSPPEDYWKKIRLPHAPMFRPQHPYESCLRERCKDVSEPAFDLLETFLSIEPHKRGTASSALMSEYFNTEPYACDPACLPKYPPNKEMDAKKRDELRRKKTGAKLRESAATRKQKKARKPLQGHHNFSNIGHTEGIQGDANLARKNIPKAKQGAVRGGHRNNPSMDTMSESSQATGISQGDIHAGPPEVTASSSFAWAKKPKDNVSTLSYNPPSSRSQISAVESTTFPFSNNPFNQHNGNNNDASEGMNPVIRMIHKQFNQEELLYDVSSELEGYKLDHPADYNPWTGQHSHNHSYDFQYPTSTTALKKNMGNVDLSGPLTSQPKKIDELLQRNENHIRRKSRFDKDI